MDLGTVALLGTVGAIGIGMLVVRYVRPPQVNVTVEIDGMELDPDDELDDEFDGSADHLFGGVVFSREQIRELRRLDRTTEWIEESGEG